MHYSKHDFYKEKDESKFFYINTQNMPLIKWIFTSLNINHC